MENKLGKLLKIIDRIGVATGNRDLSMHALNVLFLAAQADLKGERAA